MAQVAPWPVTDTVSGANRGPTGSDNWRTCAAAAGETSGSKPRSIIARRAMFAAAREEWTWAKRMQDVTLSLSDRPVAELPSLRFVMRAPLW